MFILAFLLTTTVTSFSFRSDGTFTPCVFKDLSCQSGDDIYNFATSLLQNQLLEQHAQIIVRWYVTQDNKCAVIRSASDCVVEVTDPLPLEVVLGLEAVLHAAPALPPQATVAPPEHTELPSVDLYVREDVDSILI